MRGGGEGGEQGRRWVTGVVMANSCGFPGCTGPPLAGDSHQGPLRFVEVPSRATVAAVLRTRRSREGGLRAGGLPRSWADFNEEIKFSLASANRQLPSRASDLSGPG